MAAGSIATQPDAHGSGRLIGSGMTTRFCLLALLALSLLPWSPRAGAADVAAPGRDLGAALAALDADAKRVTDIETTLEAGIVTGASEFRRLREDVASIRRAAEAESTALQLRLAEIEPLLEALGTESEEDKEAADLHARRLTLEARHQALESEARRARVLMIDSSQLLERLDELQAENFRAGLSYHTPSPLSGWFWKRFATELQPDRVRLRTLRHSLGDGLADAFRPARLARTLAGLAAGLLLIIGVRLVAEWALLRFSSTQVPSGPLRRSLHALALVVVTTLCTLLGMQAILAGIDLGAGGDAMAAAFAGVLLEATFWGALVAGLARAMLSTGRPSWRLLHIPETTARRLRWAPWVFGGAVALSVLLQHLGDTIGAGMGLATASGLIVALVHSAAIVWALLAVAIRPVESEAGRQRSLWTGLGLALLWIGVIAVWVSALVGYPIRAEQIARQIASLGIIAAMLYLLVRLVEDGLNALASTQAGRLERNFGLPSRLLRQVAVLGSALARTLAVLLIATAVLMPFDSSLGSLVQRLMRSDNILGFGELRVTLGAVVGAMLVWMVGMALVRLFKHWLQERYLPTTDLESSMTTSVVSLLGYIGTAIVLAFALSALGVSLEHVTWIASALSVGIGFGLRAIVQNLVCGLMLLAERPFRVGDWIIVENDDILIEGDVRRINVRATEIRSFDGSLLIVPNGDMIMKTVRNLTPPGAQPRLRIELPLPPDSDVEAAHQVVLEALLASSEVQEHPAPGVAIAGIGNGAILLHASASLASPRHMDRVRSELMFDMLRRLHGIGISLVPAQARPVRLPGTMPAPAS